MAQSVEPCEHLGPCPFFRRTTIVDGVAVGWKRLFCESRSKSQLCARRRLINAGENVPEELAPTGNLLGKK